jgi:uncharacterized protein
MSKLLPSAKGVAPRHPSVEFRSSGIHGCGCFAIAEIAPDTRVIEYVGEKIDKTESARRCEANNEYIFSIDDEFDLDGNVPWNPARFINHSCSPNCEALMIRNRIWIIAHRPIHPGDEVTFNYGYDLEDYAEHPCRCGAANCVGFIIAEELFEHVRQKKLAGSVLP